MLLVDLFGSTHRRSVERGEIFVIVENEDVIVQSVVT